MSHDSIGPKSGFSSTKAVHGAGARPRDGAVMTPIYQTSTYAQEALGNHKGFEYARTHNLTRFALEKNLAALESGKAHGFSFGSASRRRTRSCRCSRPATTSCAATTRTAARTGCSRRSGSATGSRSRSWTAPIPRASRRRSRLALAPRVARDADQSAHAARGHPRHRRARAQEEHHRRRGQHVHDPVLPAAARLGADVVMHSVTKYLERHSDMVGGALVTSDDGLAEQIRFLQNAAGAVPARWTASSACAARRRSRCVKQHEANARELAAILEKHPRVSRVFYPGLASHPQHEAREAPGFGLRRHDLVHPR